MPLAPEFLAAIERTLPPAALIREPERLRTYECDALTGHRAVPELVVIPESAAQVQAVVRLCHLHRVPFVARGAGTGLSGGALPVADGVVIALTRLNRVLEVDLERGIVVVEPGVTNFDVTRAVATAGFYYAPDPSSQQVCTIGGGILPAAIELMDALTLEAVEAAVAPGYPAGAGAVLIVELDGPAAQVLADSAAVERICRETGAFEVRAAEDAEERARIWRGR